MNESPPLPDQFEEIPISELNLRERTLSDLEACGVYYLRDLAGVTDVELLEWDGVGPKMVGEIKGAMKDLYWRWLAEGKRKQANSG